MELDFRYPSFAIGFHSGWNDSNNSPTTKLSLTQRKELFLKESKFSIIKAEKNAPPFFVKSKEGEIKAISSGAGSSIVKIGKEYYKIKRNGYKREGFIERKIPDRAFTLINGLNESCDDEDAGLLSLEDAQREFKIEKELARFDLIIPQKIIAIYSIKSPFGDKDSAAIIQKITTDFRADEYCAILLSNLFYDIYGKECKISLKESRFRFKEYSLKKVLEILNKKYSKHFFEIGRNIGKIYKTMHLSGYTRGISNSWYGNELICEDGKMGICDLESCFSRKEIKDIGVFGELKKTDIALAKTAFYDSMNYFENSLASFVGIKMIEGFEEGYRTNKSKKLYPKEIKRQIQKFNKIRKMIIEDD